MYWYGHMLTYCVALLLCDPFITSTSGWFFASENKKGDAETKAEIMKNRQFPECYCLQKLRTNYFSDNKCGKAALCYWEIWNYKRVKARIKGISYENEECDKYLPQSYACLIGYPSPPDAKPICRKAIVTCLKQLAKLLYDDCEEIRNSRGLAKPQDIKTTLSVEEMNLRMDQNEKTMFEPKPSSEKPITNNYYALSCPVVYRFPYFTIALLFKEWDPSIIYDETVGLRAVAHMLPKFLREGINNERIQNFDALALDQNLINWCNIPRNYICITEELDAHGKALCNCNLCHHQKTCDPNAPTPSPETDTEPDTNTTGSEPPDTKPPDTKPPDTKPPDTKPPDTKAPVTKTPGSEPPDTNTTGSEPPDILECEFGEMPENETLTLNKITCPSMSD